MTKVSFEIEPSKIKALQSALKALGIENITIEKNCGFYYFGGNNSQN